ncbi:MAG: serine hydrolase [Clostridia bacterium]|nr:serine hydrolase [Clostridia bacterium]
MDSNRKAAALLWRLTEGRSDPAILPMRVQKMPFTACTAKSTRLPRSSPEAEGVSREALERFLECAAADKEENLHSLTVLKHGRVIAECSFAPYDREIWHVTHSLCKTITSLAVGILIGEGKLRLDERIVDILEERCSAAALQHYGRLTVFHLLTMTSGASFGEMQSVTDENWVQGFLDSTPLFPVGEKFHYNSMNTYMLSAIIRAKTGKTLTKFLRVKLFDFMGIRQFWWETCPIGIEKGGWGLYLLQEDAAKLGQLILNRGKWEGRQLVSEEYIKNMCAWHSDPPEEMGKYGYGFQCWLWERPGSVHLSGLFGQSVLMVPDLDMVIAANAGSGRMFGESRFLRYCSEFLRNIEKNYCIMNLSRRGFACILQGKCGSFRENGTMKLEKSYVIQSGFGRLLPVFVQLLENSYTIGIRKIGIFRRGTALYIGIDEGESRNLLRVGFSTPARGKVTINGEQHETAVSGKWGKRDGKMVLRLDVAFLEQASTRHMELIFEDACTMRLVMRETPDKRALLDGAALLFGGDSRAVRALSTGKLRQKLDNLAEPELIFVREK